MNLTENFTLEELVHSDTANAKGIDNTPTQEIIDNLKELAENVLQPIRDKWGKPLIVNSGYRCKKLNKAVGGVSTSQHCFDRNTEVLTNHGWKNYKTIKMNDEVFSYNMETEKIEQVPIDSIVQYEFDGNLYYCENKHIQYAVTPEHRMLIRYSNHKYQRKTNKVLTEKEKKYFDSLKTENNKYHIELIEEVFKKRRFFKCAGISSNQNRYDENILRLCMATISDGFFSFKKDCKYPSIGFNLKKERDKKELEDILLKLKIDYKKRYSKTHEKQGEEGVYSYYINSTNSIEVYQIIGEKKKIPYWFLSLSSDLLKKLVITYAKFDGSIDERDNCNGITIFSKDEDNIDMLQAMCVLSDMRCVKKEFINYEINIRNKHYVLPFFYHLYITTNKNESKISENVIYQNKFYYKSIVWCVNNVNTTLITRRNGKVCFMGNCLGKAADIEAGTNDDNKELFYMISDMIENKEIIVDQLLDEARYSWIHVSYNKDKNRNQILHL